MKKKIIWSVAAVAAAALITIGILFACGVFTPSNGKKYDVSSCIMQENSPLRGKTIYWLGSSVTLGMASEEQAVADFLQATTGCICVKEAVSGTTLIDKPYKTLFSSEDSYIPASKRAKPSTPPPRSTPSSARSPPTTPRRKTCPCGEN